MGLLDKLRSELIDIIEWVDDSKHALVWRFPRYQNEIKNGAQLIVRPGQMAIFVHRSEIADVSEAGHYELKTDNLPLLSTLQAWKYGLDIPQLFIVNVSFPEAVEKALDIRTSMGVVGDMNKFQQYQMGQAMLAAADNPGGGGAEGLGMGMGFAMAQRMAQMGSAPVAT